MQLEFPYGIFEGTELLTKVQTSTYQALGRGEPLPFSQRHLLSTYLPIRSRHPRARGETINFAAVYRKCRQVFQQTIERIPRQRGARRKIDIRPGWLRLHKQQAAEKPWHKQGNAPYCPGSRRPHDVTAGTTGLLCHTE